MDIIDRMFSLVDTKFDEQREFALAIHVDPAHVSRWRNRKSTSYQRRLPQIADVLGTTVQWLVTGEELPPKSETPTPASGDGHDLFFLYNSLPSDAQKEVIAFVEFKCAQVSAAKTVRVAARGGKTVPPAGQPSTEAFDKLDAETSQAADEENDQY